MELKIGDLLEAMDTCEMENSGELALTLGGTYSVTKIEEVDAEYVFAVTDDHGDDHWFDVDEIGKEYFKEK